MAKFMKYVDRISQTKEDIASRKKDVFVQQSTHNLTGAIMQAEAAVFAASSEVITANAAVADYQIKVDASLSSTPLNVQGWINAKADITNAQLSVKDCEAAVTDAKELVTSLTSLRSNLGLDPK